MVNFTISIINFGPSNATNVNVTDVLPDGLKFLNASVIGADVINQTNSTGASVEYILEGRKIKWVLTNISEDNATISVKVQVVGLGNTTYNSSFIGNNLTLDTDKVKYVGNLTNNVTVTGSNGTSKSANVTVYPVPIVDLSVNVTSDRDVYFVALDTAIPYYLDEKKTQRRVLYINTYPKSEYEETKAYKSGAC